MKLRRATATLGVGLVGLLVSAGAAQTPASQPAPAAEPVPASQPTTAPAPAKPLKSLLDFSELWLDLGAAAAYDERSVTYPRRGARQPPDRQFNRATRFEETVGLRTQGAVVDPKYATFDVSALWGLTQERYAEHRPGRDRHDSPNGDVLQYDLSFNLLPRGKVSGTVFASQTDSRVPRAFLPSLDKTIERYGASVFVNDITLPMRFDFEHRWDALTSRTRDLSDAERLGEDRFRYEATWQSSPAHALRLEYEYTDQRQQYSGADRRFDTTRNYLVLTDTLRFGADQKSSLETVARLQDESGDIARDRAEILSRLRLQHTAALASHFALQYDQQSFQKLETRTWRGEAGLTHQLGQTLTTTLQMYGLTQQDEDNADFREWGGLLTAAFARDNALGRLAANLSYNHASLDTRNGDRNGIVIGESVTFRDPLPAYLAHPNVNGLSLVVTDANRARVYLPGRDYLIVPIGRYTALVRVRTGRIADRQTVLVSYTYRVRNDYDLVRDRVDFRVQQEFKGGFTPYYAGALQCEDVDRDRLYPYPERRVNRHRVGFTFRQPRWSAGAEYEYNDDSIDPYQAVHGNADAVLWQQAAAQLDARATASRFWFEGARGLSAHDTLLVDVGGAFRYFLADRLEANVATLYRYEDDSASGITHGVDLTGTLAWQIGYFSLRFEAEYDLLDLSDSRANGFSFWVKLRREIPVLARRAP